MNAIPLNASIYGETPHAEPRHTHKLEIMLENEPGALARVVGLFSGRGYNIDKLHVEPTAENPKISRLEIITSGTDHVIEQITLQVDRLIPVRSVDATQI